MSTVIIIAVVAVAAGLAGSYLASQVRRWKQRRKERSR